MTSQRYGGIVGHEIVKKYNYESCDDCFRHYRQYF